MKGYGDIAWPLTNLLKKDNFHWDEETTTTFCKLKEEMSIIHVLALLNFDVLFVVKSDASKIGLRLVLIQKQKHISYFSQTFTKRQMMKSVYERELMAIVFAIEKWCHYLLGRRFVVRTNQKTLKVSIGDGWYRVVFQYILQSSIKWTNRG